jgi:predicted acyltransferase
MPDGANLAIPSSGRVVSIDALRGFDMFWIVGGREVALTGAGLIVNPLPNWLEYQFEHVPWEGFTVWDLIMPLFLFVVGAVMPFSFARRIDEGRSKWQLYGTIIRRSLILFVLGMVVQGHLLDFDLSTLHIYCNTLQAIAVGYLVSGFVLLNTGIRGQVAFTASMLLGYWGLMIYLPAPSYGAGLLQPDANFALTVDTIVLGRFRDGTPYTWVLSGLTFTATVMLGAISGHVLRSSLAPRAKLATLVMLGLGSLAAGWVWSEWLGFPIIKHIWTSSMVMWAAGWSFLLLALFYLLVDMCDYRRWAFPFVVIGMNAITIYVLYFLVPFGEVADRLVGGVARHIGSGGPFVVALATVSLVWLSVYHLYRQRIFVRI